MDDPVHLKPHIDLEQGKTLPEYLHGDIPDEYLCRPLIDIDPYYASKNVSRPVSVRDYDRHFVYRYSVESQSTLSIPIDSARGLYLVKLVKWSLLNERWMCVGHARCFLSKISIGQQ